MKYTEGSWALPSLATTCSTVPQSALTGDRSCMSLCGSRGMRERRCTAFSARWTAYSAAANLARASSSRSMAGDTLLFLLLQTVLSVQLLFCKGVSILLERAYIAYRHCEAMRRRKRFRADVSQSEFAPVCTSPVCKRPGHKPGTRTRESFSKNSK